MLLQFTVENFLSFDEKAVFSMRASGDKDHASHVIGGKIPLLRGGAIYGANAAGKSNLILAMGFARDFIAPRGQNTASLSDVRPFGLRENADRPSVFHWHFIHNGKVWNYGFSLTGERVVEEYLFVRDEKSGREKKWFERKTNEGGETSVAFGHEFLDAKPSSDGQLLKLIGPRTPQTELFLRHCRVNQIAAVEAVFSWFEDVLLIVRAESDYEPLVLEANENENFLQFLSEHVRDAGTGIKQIKGFESPIDENNLAKEFSTKNSEDLKDLQNWFATLAPGETTLGFSQRQMEDNWAMFRRNLEGQLFFTSILALHITKDKKIRAFQPSWESEGTQRFLHLLPRLYQLQTRPTVLVIDELERRLHTLLTRRLVDQALNVSPQ